MLEESYKSSDTWKEILRQVTEISRQVRHSEDRYSKIIEITNGMIQFNLFIIAGNCWYDEKRRGQPWLFLSAVLCAHTKIVYKHVS